MSQQEKGVTLGWVFSCPSLWQTCKCLMDIYAWRGESTRELNLFKDFQLRVILTTGNFNSKFYNVLYVVGVVDTSFFSHDF